MKKTKGNTTYTLEHGQDNWVIFQREVKRPEGHTSIKESLSINLLTNEVHCNRTGNETNGVKRFIDLIIRIEEIFDIDNIRDFKDSEKNEKSNEVVLYTTKHNLVKGYVSNNHKETVEIIEHLKCDGDVLSYDIVNIPIKYIDGLNKFRPLYAQIEFWNNSLKAYKLVRKMKNGDLKPLFINKTQPLKIGEWLTAENHPTKGFAVRKGWHCTMKPKAPHLSKKGRVWVRVEVIDFTLYDRPENQGGKWVLAQKMKILEILQ